MGAVHSAHEINNVVDIRLPENVRFDGADRGRFSVHFLGDDRRPHPGNQQPSHFHLGRREPNRSLSASARFSHDQFDYELRVDIYPVKPDGGETIPQVALVEITGQIGVDMLPKKGYKVIDRLPVIVQNDFAFAIDRLQLPYAVNNISVGTVTNPDKISNKFIPRPIPEKSIE